MKISLDSSFSKIQNISLKKIETNNKNSTEFNEIPKENIIDLHNPRPEAVVYTARGGYRNNFSNLVTPDNGVCDCKKPEFQQMPNLTGGISTSPQVPVKAVVKMQMGDIIKLSFNACVPPLSEHVQEMGKDDTKRYVVIDGVRYESEIPKSERRNRSKTLLEMFDEYDKERAKHMERENKTNEYELAGMPRSDITIGNCEVTAYGNVDEKTKERITEVLSSII